MMRFSLGTIARSGVLFLGALMACASQGAAVDGARLANADREPGNWMSHGRTYDEQRHSPLNQITADNVEQLGLAWAADLPGKRGTEATPIVVDGVMYLSAAYSVVHALDARSGKFLWTYDPQVPKDWVVKGCCGPVNRGVAVWQGKVFVGTLDGHLVALDAATGKVAWRTLTVDQRKPYTITGAPRVVKGLVLIGNGGAEFGVRGYITAYDATTGRKRWRFYTVPGNPARPFENPVLETAAKTWRGQWWKLGGGGTVWDSMAYDAELDLLYIGVGNGSPWNQKERSPGGGDNLFLSSIVALRPSTGQYVWHFQTTPGDEWDYTATQHMILADLRIDGTVRKVLMQAPKNGFFYVLDRANGALISAKNYVQVSWASAIDATTGRPIENPEARYSKSGKLWLGAPGPGGGHNWQPMSYSPSTGLVYFPVMEGGFPYLADPQFKVKSMGYNVGVDLGSVSMPADPKVRAGAYAAQKGYLLAWDPIRQQEVWRANQPGPWNGGVLSTAGDLVFEGNALGHFQAFKADDGQRLWQFDGQSGIQAAPISYSVDGEQYVSVLAGREGALALVPGEMSLVSGREQTISRVLTFKLGGKASLPAVPEAHSSALNPPVRVANDQTVQRGKALYGRFCSVCHGDAAVGGRVITDLRRSPMLGEPKLWLRVVLEGALRPLGMASFAPVLNRSDANAIRAYVIERAREDAALAEQGHTQPPTLPR